MEQCEICAEMGLNGNCIYCSLGNPCLNCEDYDITSNKCKSDGACADTRCKEE